MSGLRLIPTGTVFAPEDITFWFGKDSGRTLDEAIREASILVTTPHGGSALPAELREFVVEDYTERLQLDYTDCTTAPICRAWAAIDPAVLYVENPHPRLVRDPNRARPENVAGDLRTAIERVRAAGPDRPVDLTGVDAIRPVAFSFAPVLVIPDQDEELTRLTETFAAVAAHGLDVYERTRDTLRAAMFAAAFERTGSARALWHLAFHDTMNTTARPDGAIVGVRAPADRLPEVVSLSNRGDASGDRRVEDPVVTMLPEDIRALAIGYRDGFDVELADDVALNQPYLGSQEIIESGAFFDAWRGRAHAAGVRSGAVQAEFLREYLLGAAATAVLHEPGTDWPAPDAAHVLTLADACRDSWSAFRWMHEE
ncbi:N-formylglutamate amidohydrolase [Microbacterium gorillae]|uniref:N-formylglutamate amidohydrolase n=1 Tax=Microbacterium gorillae TaxID=1231063 RepID=UPI000590816F|nr:N-formylglutamate amidohydrolase [Microbacterium gorillae]